MSRFKAPDTEESVGCNLIPMIDIMFLLLLFFMLGADMTQRELEEVVLPKADQVKDETKEKAEGDMGTTTVNVFHRGQTSTFSCPPYAARQVCREKDHWLIAIRSKEFPIENLKQELDYEAKLSPLEENQDPKAAVKLSTREVGIRADECAPYGFIQSVIEGCAAVGIYRIKVAAARPDPTG